MEPLTQSSPIFSRPPRSLTPRRFWLSMAVLFFAIVVLARANVLTFPLPNEDDARFFLPAWSLAVHGSLRVPVLNAPDGIFWIPHGFYLWLALFFRIFAPTVTVARTVGQLTTAAAAVLLVLAYARLCASRSFALLCGLLLVSPGVIFAANTIRMESLMLLLFATGIVLHSYSRRPAAAVMFLLAVVVHPALLLGATLYTASILWTRLRDHRNRLSIEAPLLTLAIAACAAAAIALEGAYVWHHLPTFHQHMAYQIARKADRSPMQMLLTKRGLLLIGELLFTSVVVACLVRSGPAWNTFSRQLLPLFLLALGLSTYATLGREIPYNLYSYAAVPATFFCLARCVLSLLEPSTAYPARTLRAPCPHPARTVRILAR